MLDAMFFKGSSLKLTKNKPNLSGQNPQKNKKK
jgi:hypothetical protein